jgi:hypothetical protein
MNIELKVRAFMNIFLNIQDGFFYSEYASAMSMLQGKPSESNALRIEFVGNINAILHLQVYSIRK